jgi:hypothetical protein
VDELIPETEDYWMAELLGIAFDEDELIIRLGSLLGQEDEKPVIQLHLQKSKITEDGLAEFKNNLFNQTDVLFQKTASEKYLEFQFDYDEDSFVRIDYFECIQKATTYTFEELTTKLKLQEEKYFAQSNIYSEENRRLQKILHQLKHEIWKELDRSERKSEFFAFTEKAIRFNERVLCYQKIYEWIELLEKEEAPKSN